MSKIGVFDSGLGGLWMLKHLRELMPEYDYVFYGDQKNVPYGEKTIEQLLEITKTALEFLYKKQNCSVVLLACNTVSTNINTQLREWVNKKYPGKLVFGLVKPTVESLINLDNLFLTATTRTIESGLYQKELANINSLTTFALPDLARIVERGEDAYGYILQFQDLVPPNITNGALLCTHYGIVLDDFKKVFPGVQNWYCQENIIPKYMKSYFESKPQVVNALSKNSSVEFFVTASNKTFDKFLNTWFPGSIIQNAQS